MGDEKFLRDYFATEAWLDKNDDEDESGSNFENSDSESGDDFLTKKSNKNDKRHLKLKNSDSEEDELFVQQQEKAAYEQMLSQHIENEAKYRHQEVGSDKLQSVPRRVEDSIKQNIEDESRKAKRKKEKEKEAAAKKQKLDDIKLLKKLKEDEIAEKLSEIKKHGDFEDLEGMDEMKD